MAEMSHDDLFGIIILTYYLRKVNLFRISGGSTVWHLGKLYLIGGYTIEYDVELKSFYQNPTNTVWVFDPAKGFWNQGPSLPR